ncbi:hypothetical protein VD659_04365 [Herbiconiux sp. 11R-BC]|uniref:hypothetical protein n=1 Tax=Herbiconiux sp. 11R-BC TaxID=3111637 RepID=UPI0010F47976
MPKPVAFLLLVAVAAGAYVAGTKAGRSRYREISGVAKKFWDDPAVAKARKRSYKQAEKAATKIAKKIGA